MPSVLLVGMAVIDFLFEVESIPRASEKYIAHAADIVGGGAANAACAIAKLGGHAVLAARVGDDFIGNRILEDLRHHSVDCSLIKVTRGARSSYSSVLLDKSGERQIVNYRGSGLSDDVSDIESVGPAAVLADTRWAVGTLAAFKVAKNSNIPAVLDAESPIDPVMLELASHIAFSRQGLESLVGAIRSTDELKSGLRKVAEKYTAWLAVTDGANGVFSINRGELFHHAAIPVKVVDTLGAGDVWHGAFTYRLACGYDENESVMFANVAAALKCARPGGGRVCPDSEEVQSCIEKGAG